MSISNDDKMPRDAGNWAESASSLKVTYVPTGALNINVEGRQAVSPLQGFGQMWQKTYTIRLEGVTITPAEVIKTWKEHFTTFWPKGNRFYAPLTGIAPGEVALIKMDMPGGMALSTGVMVLYADDVSFTVMTPQGHVFAGWNTFSAYEEDDCAIVQIQVLIRANDPIYELGFRLGASKTEDKFWEYTLIALATHFGVRGVPVSVQRVCVDPRLQWAYAKNIWQNAALGTTIYLVTAPIRWVQKKMRRPKP